MAERHTAVHAATGLTTQDLLVAGLVDLFPVHDAHGHGTTCGKLPLGHLQEAFGVSHRSPPGCGSTRCRRRGRSPRPAPPRACSARAAKSRGSTFTNSAAVSSKLSRSADARGEAVRSTCATSRLRSTSRSARSSGSSRSSPLPSDWAFTLLVSSACTYATPRTCRHRSCVRSIRGSRRARRHVLQRVVAHTLDDRGRARVADEEALTHDTGDEHRPPKSRRSRSRCRRSRSHAERSQNRAADGW